MSTNSLVRALLTNDQKCIFGNNGTASSNVRLNREGAGILALVTGDDVTAEGSVSTTPAMISARAANYATASLPATFSSGTKGWLAFDTTATTLKYNDGAAWQTVASGASSARISAIYDWVVGSAAQVTSGAATHSTWASAIAAASAGDSILGLKGAWTENVSIDKKLYVEGRGEGTVITGTLTFTSTSDNSYVTALKFTDTVTLNSGADGIIVDNIFLASGKSFTDNGSGNILMAMQET